MADSESYDPAGATQGLGLQWWSGDYYSGQVFSEFKIFQAFYISIYNDIYIRANIYISHLWVSFVIGHSARVCSKFVFPRSRFKAHGTRFGTDCNATNMRVTCMYVCMYIILYTDIILIYLLYIYITYYCIICQHLSISGLHFWCRLWHHVAMVRRWQWPFDRQRHQRLTGPECPGCVGRDWGHRLGERQPHGSWGSGKAEWMSPDVTSFGFWILMDLWIFMCIWGILRRSTLLSTCVFFNARHM